MSVSIDRFAILSEHRTCLVYRIDKGLRVVTKEATDRVTLIATQEYIFDQGEFA